LSGRIFGSRNRSEAPEPAAAQPEAAVQDKIDPPPKIGGDQLIDSRIDSGVFSSDSETGNCAKKRKTPEVPKGRRKKNTGQIDDERQVEYQPSPEAVGHPAK
jgi:hypothetical protein